MYGNTYKHGGKEIYNNILKFNKPVGAAVVLMLIFGAIYIVALFSPQTSLLACFIVSLTVIKLLKIRMNPTTKRTTIINLHRRRISLSEHDLLPVRISTAILISSLWLPRS